MLTRPGAIQPLIKSSSIQNKRQSSPVTSFSWLSFHSGLYLNSKSHKNQTRLYCQSHRLCPVWQSRGWVYLTGCTAVFIVFSINPDLWLHLEITGMTKGVACMYAHSQLLQLSEKRNCCLQIGNCPRSDLESLTVWLYRVTLWSEV